MRIPLLWTAPFLSLVAGYVSMRMLITPATIKAPLVSGISIEVACKILADHNIAMQIIQYKVDPDTPHNTVINQTPAAHHTMRPHQTMFLTVSQEPVAQKTPDFYQKNSDAIKNMAIPFGIKVYCYPLKVPFCKQQCFAQYPAAHSPLKQRSAIVYIASQESDPVIWPKFIGKRLDEVLLFLEKFSITPHISYASVHDQGLVQFVIDQRPIAGSLIDFKEEKKPIVQLKVAP
jgi:beta-lactam-binding protein with PASTA domain